MSSTLVSYMHGCNLQWRRDAKAAIASTLPAPTADCSCKQQVHGPPAQLRNCNEGLVASDNKTGHVTYEKIITCTLDMV